MNFSIKITNIKSVEKIPGYWKNKDYINLLELFDFPDAASVSENELFEMLAMAISDFEPPEAAEIVLTYKLKDHLSENQIKNISFEMLEDKVWEEYADISLHYPLFNCNQLLYEAYNGKFPKAIASVIDFELTLDGDLKVSKEIALRTLSDLLSDKSLLKRLFREKLDSGDAFTDAESIIWELHSKGENTYQLISSDYWLNKEDFDTDEFSGTLRDDEIDHLQ